MSDRASLQLLRGNAPRPVLELTEARRTFDPAQCDHLTITVDAQLAEVTCRTCQVRLSPMAILIRMAREESRWNRERQHHNAMLKALEAKERTKCQHCGKLTRVNISRSDTPRRGNTQEDPHG